MLVNEYGNRNDPTVILLAPMMISGSDLYQHCGYMAAHPKEYVEEIEQFIRRPV